MAKYRQQGSDEYTPPAYYDPQTGSMTTPGSVADLGSIQSPPSSDHSISPGSSRSSWSSSNQKKRGRSSDKRIRHPCAIEGCKRKGTRLFSSLRGEYKAKVNHTNRCCEGCYRRDLRRYKKEHPEPLNKSRCVGSSSDKKKKKKDSTSSKANKSTSSSQKQKQFQQPPAHTNSSTSPFHHQHGQFHNSQHLTTLTQKSPMQYASTAGGQNPEFSSASQNSTHSSPSQNAFIGSSATGLNTPPIGTNVPSNSSVHRPGSLVLPTMMIPTPRHSADNRNGSVPHKPVLSSSAYAMKVSDTGAGSVYRNPTGHHAYIAVNAGVSHRRNSCQMDEVLFSKFCSTVLRYEGLIE